MSDDDIDYSDLPPSTEEELAGAELRMPKRKSNVTLQLDSDILAWFKARGEGYQRRINAILREYVTAQAGTT